MATCYVNRGVECLLPLSTVVIEQRGTGFFSGNKYSVFTAQKELLLQAKEQGTGFGSERRGFEMYLQNANGDNVIVLKRPYTFGGSKLKVYVSGVLVSIIRQKTTFMDTVLYINDAIDKPVLRVKGKFGDFELQTAEKKVIGHLRKNFSGLMKELFTSLDNFEISFPQDLNVNYKAAVIGACILIDFLNYEK